MRRDTGPAQGGVNSRGGALAGTRVIVVDDSSTIRRCAESFLSQAGCEVILAEDGFDSLAKIEDGEADLILMDIIMPRMNGYQACALLRKGTRHRSTPVVMLSSKDSTFDRAQGRMAGSNDHLAKPFTKETLLKAVEVHRARRRPANAATQARASA